MAVKIKLKMVLKIQAFNLFNYDHGTLAPGPVDCGFAAFGVGSFVSRPALGRFLFLVRGPAIQH